MQQNRISHYDLAGGILILWIMAFHPMSQNWVFDPEDVRVVLPYLVFSMPWFFYKAGHFFKVMDCREGVKKDVRKLLFPFLKWTAVGYAIYLVMQLIDGTFTWHSCVVEALDVFSVYGYIPVDVPAWFLLSLMVVRIAARYLIKWKVPAEVCTVVCIGIGFGIHLSGNNLPFYLSNIPMGLAFFMVGYKYGRFENNRGLFALCAAGYIAFLVFGPSVVGHHRNVLLSGYYLLWPLYAYCGIVVFNNLCRLAVGAVEHAGKHFLDPLMFIGRHTLTLLVTHAFVYMPWVHYTILTPWQTVICTYICYAIFLTPLMVWEWKKSRRPV